MAKKTNFGFAEINGMPYWDETHSYSFTREEIESVIEPAIQSLQDIAMEFVNIAVDNEIILTEMGIPNWMWQTVKDSWLNKSPDCMGRFDLAYTSDGRAYMLEYNADTPGMVYETGYFQLLWLKEMIEAGNLPASAEQFNHLQDDMIAFFRENFPEKPVHFSCMANAMEDRTNLAYIENLAKIAGCKTAFADIELMYFDVDQHFHDDDGTIIQNWFKYYPWEWLVAEPMAGALPEAKVNYIEPAWKMLLSNKACLPFLWRMFEGHPNLLPTYFAEDPDKKHLGESFVIKPALSREGANIGIFENGKNIAMSLGPYTQSRQIVQTYAPLPVYEGSVPVLGGWVVNGAASALAVREDNSMITHNNSRFVPHYVID